MSLEGCVTKVEVATTNTSLTNWPSLVLTHLDSFEVVTTLPTQLDSKSFFKVHCNSVVISPVNYSNICPIPFNDGIDSLSSSEVIRFVKLNWPILLQDQLALILESRPNRLPSCLSTWRSKLVEKPSFHKQEVFTLCLMSTSYKIDNVLGIRGNVLCKYSKEEHWDELS